MIKISVCIFLSISISLGGLAQEQQSKRQISPAKIKFCNDLVMEILQTSPDYQEKVKDFNKAIVANGGLYYALYLSAAPTDPESNSNSYKIDLHEVYTNRFPRIASFEFDPHYQDLNEVFYHNDKKISMRLNTDLLIKYNMGCGLYSR